MIQGPEDIRRLRRQTGMTQKQLARTAGVSQSMIAKVEAGLMDPSYSNMKKISDALEQQTAKHTKHAADVMATSITSIRHDRSITYAIRLMRKHGFSQLPVRRDGIIVGSITERRLLDAIMDKRSTVHEVMEEAPPSVSPESPLTAVIDLLHYFPMVLVTTKGRPVGIITKTDVLSSI